MKLYLIRHGQTEWNSLRRVQGRTDIPLNSRGIAQAEAVAKHMKCVGVDALYSSPLSRAIDTAKIVALATGQTGIKIADELTEIDFGLWEGNDSDMLKRRFPEYWKDWNWITHPEMCKKIGAESAMSIGERTLRAVAQIMAENDPDARVAAVTHTMPLKILTARLIGMPVDCIQRLRIDNCAVTEIELFENGGCSLRCWNDTSYLEGLI